MLGAELAGAEVPEADLPRAGMPQRSCRGRHAEAVRNDRRVLDAARKVFAAQGAGAQVSAIAAGAGSAWAAAAPVTVAPRR